MIEVGDLIRTRSGKFDKVINNNYYMPQYIECEKGIVDKENIVKHSKNIVGLVEIGDFVNGELVDFITSKGDILIRDKINFFNKYNKIKTILTKEQYMQNCYEIPENISDIN